MTDCFQIADLDFPAHKYEAWEPVVPYRLRHEGETKDTQDIFAIIRQGDLLVHHPYDSFGVSVQRLVEEAAADERVLAIKQTLYRTSDDSPILKALMRAGESGKQVAVLVEVKARFDEANNIEWGRMLENSGRTRGLRAGRLEDACQDDAYSTPGAGRCAHLLPYRYGQLQF